MAKNASSDDQRADQQHEPQRTAAERTAATCNALGQERIDPAMNETLAAN